LVIPATKTYPDYIDVMGLDLVAGRGFRDQDAGTGAVVVDLDLARFLWGDEYPVGRRFRMGDDGEWHTVVGVVREHRLFGRDERFGPYQVLRPADPGAAPTMGNVPLTSLYLRARGDPAALQPVLHEALAALDPDLSALSVLTATHALAAQEQQPRFLATLMTLFAGVAVSLAAVGLYGVLAYTVSLRQRELGIRAALGADRRRLRSMVLRQGLGMAATGVLAGIAGSYLATRALAGFLYEVEPGDPGTLIVTTMLFLLIAMAASHLPARRATRVDPVVVLRAE
jgi:predicted lysophospholipase L1 biosynthesis ABC-type transport system permease subunit